MKYLIILLTLIGSMVTGDVYTISDKSEMVITGTSTLHDWDCTVTEMSGQFETNKTFPDFGVVDVSVSVNVPSIECSKGRIMNNKMKDALKSDKHPTITFNFAAPDNTTNGAVLDGTVTLAGVTLPQRVYISEVSYVARTSTYSVAGYADIDMTEFNVKPPSAMMGAIETGKDVRIEFNVLAGK